MFVKCDHRMSKKAEETNNAAWNCTKVSWFTHNMRSSRRTTNRTKFLTKYVKQDISHTWQQRINKNCYTAKTKKHREPAVNANQVMLKEQQVPVDVLIKSHKIKRFHIYLSTKMCLRSFLHVLKVDIAQSLQGNLFHTVGAATANTLSPQNMFWAWGGAQKQGP